MATASTATSPADPAPQTTIWMPSKHMGNLLVSLRTLEALVHHFGAANSRLVIDSTYRHIIEAADLGCAVLYYPRRDLARRPRWRALPLLWGFLRALRALPTDLAIAIEDDRPSQRLIALSGARRSLGPDGPDNRSLQQLVALDHQQSHRFYDYAAIARAVTEVELVPGYIPLTVSDQGQRQLDEVLRVAGFETGRPICVLHPGATKQYKQWPAKSFAELAHWLYLRGYQVVVTGAGQRDGATIADFRQHCDTPYIDLHNRLDIAALIALFQRTALFVGNDTGPTHLAAANDIPTLAIFGPTDEYRWGPLGSGVVIVRHPQACRPDCLRGRCSVDHRCITTLAPAVVQDAIVALP